MFFLFTVKSIKDCFPLIWVIFYTIQQEFTSYLQKHDEVLTELEKATKRLKKLEVVYKEFELQKVCYLPFNTFLLKPIQRLLHYKLILGRLCKHYTAEHRDFADCRSEWALSCIRARQKPIPMYMQNFACTLGGTNVTVRFFSIQDLSDSRRVSCAKYTGTWFRLLKTQLLSEYCNLNIMEKKQIIPSRTA